MSDRIINNIKDREYKMSMRAKLILSLSLIGVTLLVSSVISMMEYSRMSTYVSDLIAGNIRSINAAQQISELSNSYNLDILTVIGEDGKLVRVPVLENEDFQSRCDTLRSTLTDSAMLSLVDSVQTSFSEYLTTSHDLPIILSDDFTDTRDWYFFQLQPKFKHLSSNIGNLTDAIYSDLEKNSFTFQRGFYRSIVPGFVAVLVGLLLILLLMFFLIVYYVNPLKKMLKHLQAYKDGLKRTYDYDFEGNDELATLNSDIKEIVEESVQNKKRVAALRDTLSQRTLM